MTESINPLAEKDQDIKQRLAEYFLGEGVIVDSVNLILEAPLPVWFKVDLSQDFFPDINSEKQVIMAVMHHFLNSTEDLRVNPNTGDVDLKDIFDYHLEIRQEVPGNEIPEDLFNELPPNLFPVNLLSDELLVRWQTTVGVYYDSPVDYHLVVMIASNRVVRSISCDLYKK